MGRAVPTRPASACAAAWGPARCLQAPAPRGSAKPVPAHRRPRRGSPLGKRRPTGPGQPLPRRPALRQARAIRTPGERVGHAPRCRAHADGPRQAVSRHQRQPGRRRGRDWAQPPPCGRALARRLLFAAQAELPASLSELSLSLAASRPSLWKEPPGSRRPSPWVTRALRWCIASQCPERPRTGKVRKSWQMPRRTRFKRMRCCARPAPAHAGPQPRHAGRGRRRFRARRSSPRRRGAARQACARRSRPGCPHPHSRA